MKTFFFFLQRIHLDIRVGEHFLDESAIQAKDKVNEVNVRLENLIEQIHHVTREQDYERVCVSLNVNVKNIVHRLINLQSIMRFIIQMQGSF